MNYTARQLLTGAIVLWVAALACFALLRVAYGAPPPVVHVRWAADVDDSRREQFEREYGLVVREGRESRTWVYYLTNTSTENVRALVTNPAAEDTHYIHRTEFRVGRLTPRGPYLNAGTSTPGLLQFLIRACVVVGGIAFVAAGVQRWRGARLQPPRAA